MMKNFEGFGCHLEDTVDETTLFNGPDPESVTETEVAFILEPEFPKPESIPIALCEASYEAWLFKPFEAPLPRAPLPRAPLPSDEPKDDCPLSILEVKAPLAADVERDSVITLFPPLSPTLTELDCDTDDCPLPPLTPMLLVNCSVCPTPTGTL
uniref:Uncharacterized protein n=1 Tax=Tetranychus urticae TaxID=32264 RepID=T1JVE7_TETUR